MGDRFYLAQKKALGRCPGDKSTTNRRKSVAWDDDKRQKAVSLYEEAEPTAENTVEIVKQIAEELDESPNGVRAVLTKAGVYIKKTGGTSKSTGDSSSSTGGTRVTKAKAKEDLVAAINTIGGEVDDEIIDRMTGKAMQYFTGILSSVSN